MLYHHISEKERRQIEELVQAGNSNKTIAARLGRSRSTIGREIRRNMAYGGRGYFSKRAQELALDLKILKVIHDENLRLNKIYTTM